MILLIDNKQTPSSSFRMPRYFLFKNILEKENVHVNLIVGSWHHGLKKRIQWKQEGVFFINTVSYINHIGLRRLLSEMCFGFQLLKYINLFRKAKIIVINDAGFFYNYIIYLLSFVFRKKIVLDSNDLWPEIFFKKESVKRFAYHIKKQLYRFSSYIISVNKEYLDYYKYLKDKSLGVIYLGYDTSYYYSIKTNLFDKDSRKFLYLGSLGANYEIETLCRFILNNEDYSLDCFGSGVKEEIVLEYAVKSGGRITLSRPMSLESFKDIEKKYCFGVAIYSENSLVEFPTKLFDYWTFSLPVLVNVGGEVREKIINNTSLGMFLLNDELIERKKIENYLINYKGDINKDDFLIEKSVANFYHQLKQDKVL